MRISFFAMFTIIFLFLAWFSWKSEKENDDNKISPASTAAPVTSRTYSEASSTQTKSAAVTRNTNEHDNIERTLRIVAEKWRSTDVNSDGLYNCIDAAVLFYQYYPDKSKVCIMINKNPATGMHHLFNCVFTEGVWKAIEPQAYANRFPNYLMLAVWGNQYDKTYNRDETEIWKVYVK